MIYSNDHSTTTSGRTERERLCVTHMISANINDPQFVSHKVAIRLSPLIGFINLSFMNSYKREKKNYETSTSASSLLQSTTINAIFAPRQLVERYRDDQKICIGFSLTSRRLMTEYRERKCETAFD